jgi:DNA-directed RNA polymerase subunit RPC12/RpoP
MSSARWVVSEQKMSLDGKLMNVLLSHPCPHCGNNRIMHGRWFAVIGNYRCARCTQQVRMTYPAKVALFEGHAHLSPPFQPGHP